MIIVDADCSKKLIGLIQDIDLVIPVEWRELVKQLVEQLNNNVCEESLVSLILCFLKKQLCTETIGERETIDLVEGAQLEEKKQEIVGVLSCLLFQQQTELFNSIRR